jgi:hypothetical protein
VIQLYAIADHPGPPLPDAIAPLREVAAGRLAAICGPADDGLLTAEALWAHERVVEALMATRDVLPVRYGTRLPDDQAVERVLASEHDRFADLLESVRGAAEVAVRAMAVHAGAAPPGQDAPDEPVVLDAQRAGSGTEYLRRRAGDTATRKRAADAIHAPLAAAARAACTRPVRLPGELLRSAYLVERGAVEPFARLVAKLDDDNPDLQLSCTGPWPPYSFAQR